MPSPDQRTVSASITCAASFSMACSGVPWRALARKVIGAVCGNPREAANLNRTVTTEITKGSKDGIATQLRVFDERRVLAARHAPVRTRR